MLTVLQGDAFTQLKTLPAESVQCCVTSPPYWGLRDYSTQGQLGLEPTPELYVARMVLVFREVRRCLRKDGTLWLNLGSSYASDWNSRRAEGGGGFKDNGRERIKECPAGFKPKDMVPIPWMVAMALQQPYYTGKIKSIEDRIWLASIIDGEGCMFIHKRKTGASNGQGYFRKNDSYGAGLEVANTHRSIVERCLEITGIGSICTVERESKHGKHRNIPLHRWNLRSNQCRDVIREIYPHLVGKQHEARVLLGCPSSGPKAEAAHAAMLLLHNARATTVDFPAPASMFEQGWYLRSDIIWSKLNPMPESVQDRPTKAHEYVFLLTKNSTYFYDAEAIREPIKDSQDGSIRARARTANGALGGENQHNIEERIYDRICGANKRSVWTVPTNPYPDAHFATYPPDLIKPMIMAGSRIGDVILDPFAGSGTTGQVALELGRRATLIELNEKYINLINQRCTTTIGLPLA